MRQDDRRRVARASAQRYTADPAMARADDRADVVRAYVVAEGEREGEGERFVLGQANRGGSK